MYSVIVRILFLLPAETAHYFTLNLLRLLYHIPFLKRMVKSHYAISHPVDFAGIRFPNKIGLAAGFDKNAKYLSEFQSLGFGFVEIGTVTPKPQAGNDKPRLFRLIKDQCLINRMGFNNDGVEAIADRLKHKPSDMIIGGNIGKNKTTPNELAVNDYIHCFARLYDWVDYFVINVSSPNTPNLRELQDKEPLKKILSGVMQLREELTSKGKIRKPVLLKIAPDLSPSQLDDVIEIVVECKLNGIVATNTTISREGLITPKEKIEAIGAGGLSGPIIKQKSTDVIAYISQKTNGTLPIIGVGGIDSEESGSDKLKAGATLLQLYTGFIYKGPSLVKKLAQL